jgi:hypothetical protein
MSNHNITGSSQTYSMYLYGTNDVKAIWSGDFGDINLSKHQYVMMGITSEISNWGWATAAGTVVAGATLYFVSGPIGWVAGGIVAAGVGGAAGAGANHLATVVKGESGNEYLSPAIIEVNSKEFDSLKCDEIASIS